MFGMIITALIALGLYILLFRAVARAVSRHDGSVYLRDAGD
jgi:hypothetical protein